MEGHNDHEKDPILEADKTKNLTSSLVFAAAVVVIGSSFQFGYNSGVINAPESVIESYINETHFKRYGAYIDRSQMNLLWGVTVAIFAVGGMIGSFAAGYFADRLGRKKTLFLNNFVALAGVVLMSTAKFGYYELLIAGRFVIGFNCGVNTGLAPLYLTEVAPLNLRGSFGTLNQMGIVTSMLISQILGLPQLLGTAYLWPVLLAMPVAFAVFQLICLPFCPDTPSYLLTVSKVEEAQKSLEWFRSCADVGEEMLSIQREQEAAPSKVGIMKIFKTRYLLQPLIIAIVMQCSQQLSGINAVLYYSTSIFETAGVPPKYSPYVTVGVGLANVVMCGISVPLMERAGRRLLHLLGLAGMFFCALILIFSITFYTSAPWLRVISIIAVLLFVVFFQAGPGSIPWFITAELFRQDARPAAISIAGLVNWTGNFLVGIAYPPLQTAILGYTFIIFAVLIAIFWLFTYFKLPETKGKTINEIMLIFQQENSF